MKESNKKSNKFHLFSLSVEQSSLRELPRYLGWVGQEESCPHHSDWGTCSQSGKNDLRTLRGPGSRYMRSGRKAGGSCERINRSFNSVWQDDKQWCPQEQGQQEKTLSTSECQRTNNFHSFLSKHQDQSIIGALLQLFIADCPWSFKKICFRRHYWHIGSHLGARRPWECELRTGWWRHWYRSKSCWADRGVKGGWRASVSRLQGWEYSRWGLSFPCFFHSKNVFLISSKKFRHTRTFNSLLFPSMQKPKIFLFIFFPVQSSVFFSKLFFQKLAPAVFVRKWGSIGWKKKQILRWQGQ